MSSRLEASVANASQVSIRLEAASRVAGSLVGEPTPGWDTPEEIQAWVRALRCDETRRAEVDADRLDVQSDG